MTVATQMKILKTNDYYKYLKENSNWIKELNRHDSNINNYITFLKDKYSLRVTDKVSEFIDNIDIIQSVLNVLK